MTRNEVEREAQKFLRTCGIMPPPTPVEEIAVTKGIKVVRTAGDWNESGFLLRENGQALIGINSRNSARRQRFTIAHELGHWLLHKGKPLIVDQSVMINKRDDISSQASSTEEIEANQFAASLLMPAPLVEAEIAVCMASEMRSREELISALARTFDVSTDAMGWRLINLGILST